MQKFNPEVIVHVAVFSRGKPQKHSFGAVCSDGRGKALVSVAKFIGIAARSDALKRGLLWSLEQAQRLLAEKIEIRVDDPGELERLKTDESLHALLNGFRFCRAVRLNPGDPANQLAEKASQGWREVLKK